MTPEVKKHYGKHKSTGERCIVLMRELPGTNEALVVLYESLKDPYDVELMAMADNADGQAADPLSDYLNKKAFSTGVPVVQGLHEHGYIKKVPANMITMDLGQGNFIQLDKLNDMINGQNPDRKQEATQVESQVVDQTDTGPVDSSPSQGDGCKFEEALNIVGRIETVLVEETDTDKMINVARNIEKSAKKIREAVYAIDPSYKKGGKR